MFIKATLMAAYIDRITADGEPNRSSLQPGARERLLQLLRYFRVRLDVARQRRRLRALDDAALNDIGISRAEALREASRSFWDIPEHLQSHQGTRKLAERPSGIRR